MPNEILEKLKHDQYVAERKLTRRACSSTTSQPKSPDENNKKRRVFLQRFKCCKNTRHGAGGGT